MTVIAWDGKTLAADKQATNAGYRRKVTKIFRVPTGLVGLAGDGDHALTLLHWFNSGMDPANWPESQKDGNGADAYYVDRTGTMWLYGKSPRPQRVETKFEAGGSGRDYALAAMYLGCDSRKAVEVASYFDNGCGHGIDALTLENTPAPSGASTAGEQDAPPLTAHN